MLLEQILTLVISANATLDKDIGSSNKTQQVRELVLLTFEDTIRFNQYSVSIDAGCYGFEGYKPIKEEKQEPKNHATPWLPVPLAVIIAANYYQNQE